MSKQDKRADLLERLELDISFAVPAIIKEMKKARVFNPKDRWVVLDRAIAGGQLVGPIEEEFEKNGVSPNGRVYGCEEHKITVNYAKSERKLQGTYTHTGSYMIEPKFDNITFAPDSERDFKLCEVGNYPYNDGSINNNVIWNKFISDVRASDTDFVGVVVQASFLSQQFNGMSKSVKQDLIALGCYKIIVNDYADFDETKAKVKTCIVFCRKGYEGLVTYVERKTGFEVVKLLDEPFDMIFDPATVDFLSRIDTARTSSFNRFDQYGKWIKDNPANADLWAIGSYYKTEGFDKNPLKQFIIIPPNSGKEKNFYVVFGSATSEANAEAKLSELNSFWFSDIVQAILVKTRYSISLDKTQYARVPETVIDHVFTEDELATLWKIPKNLLTEVRKLVKDCDYKKKDRADANDN